MLPLANVSAGFVKSFVVKTTSLISSESLGSAMGSAIVCNFSNSYSNKPTIPSVSRKLIEHASVKSIGLLARKS